MNFALMLQGAELAGSVLTAGSKRRSASRVADAQQKTAALAFKYNTEQVRKSYKQAFGNSMLQYIQNRKNQTSQYEDMKSKLNLEQSANGVNVAKSSYDNDINNSLDLEFTTNIQDMYSNLLSRNAGIISNKIGMTYNLGNQYLNQKDAISQTEQKVKDHITNDIMQKGFSFATSAFDKYQANSEKSKLTNDDNTGKFFSNFHL